MVNQPHLQSSGLGHLKCTQWLDFNFSRTFHYFHPQSGSKPWVICEKGI